MARPSIKNCDGEGLHKLTKALAWAINESDMRRRLIFTAGALNNRKLLKELGSQESSNWYEGRRAADPTFDNPYWPGR